MHRDDPKELAGRTSIRATPTAPCALRAATTLACRSWLTEPHIRMIQNNLDPEVAENPKGLVVYGGIGRAARDWASFDAILAALKVLGDDESLLIQSGKPVGVFKTHPDAPRVLIANSNLVPRWATWEHFNELDRKGLMMFGQMTAGSWIYIGSQGIVQGNLRDVRRSGPPAITAGPSSGRWVLTAGLGGMGGAQPLAATMAGASIARDRVPAVAHRDAAVDALPRRGGARPRRRARAHPRRVRDRQGALASDSVGNAAEILPELVRRGVRPTWSTDQTSAHDLVHGYLPAGWTVERWQAAQADPRSTRRSSPAAQQSCAGTSRRMLAFHGRACRRSTTATTCGRSRRTRASPTRSRSRASSPRTSGRCSAKARARSAGSRCPAIPRTSARPTARSSAVPARRAPQPLARHGRRAHRFPGIARAHLLARPRRAPSRGARVQRDGASGEVKAPIVIGRDHLDAASVASPNRETESMADGSDAVSDWPLLNALLNTAGARPGCRSTTAAASAWDTRSTRAW
jgi:urocanate hydratase